MENTQFLHLLNGISEPDPGPVPEGWDIRTHQITQKIARTIREMAEPFIAQPMQNQKEIMLERTANAIKEYYYKGYVQDINYSMTEDEEGNLVGRVEVVPFEMLQKVYINVNFS